MPIQHAVLGLLSDGPSYGYQLKASFEEAVGPQWGELNIGHLYQVLDRLVRDGLVKPRVVAQQERPDKIVYRLTSAGRAELESWLNQPFRRQGGYRDDVFLKLLVASRMGQDRLRTVIRVQQRAYVAELGALTELQDAHRTEPVVSLLIEAAIKHTEANLSVLETASSQIKKLAAALTRLDEAGSGLKASG